MKLRPDEPVHPSYENFTVMKPRRGLNDYSKALFVIPNVSTAIVEYSLAGWRFVLLGTGVGHCLLVLWLLIFRDTDLTCNTLFNK